MEVHNFGGDPLRKPKIVPMPHVLLVYDWHISLDPAKGAFLSREGLPSAEGLW